MMLQSTKTASKQQDNLNELRRQAELESLRPFVKDSCCFLPKADPDTHVIGMDELKKLARSWKLHGKIYILFFLLILYFYHQLDHHSNHHLPYPYLNLLNPNNYFYRTT